MYIHQSANWPRFRWNAEAVALPLEKVTREQGRLFGRLEALGFDSRLSAVAENLALDLVHSSEIEGVLLNADQVRSSIARRLGINHDEDKSAPSHYIDGVVEVMVDAMEHYDRDVTPEMLGAWQATFFPTGYSGGVAIEVGHYRTHEEHIVSGYLGRERIHYVAPAPDRIQGEMDDFLNWFNAPIELPTPIAAAIAHLWFVSIHPFEDGNGRLSRILSDIIMARGDHNNMRFYNISTAINNDKRHYYRLLEKVQHGDGEITEWIVWFLKTIDVALQDANSMVSTVLSKSIFWLRAADVVLSKRQIDTLNLFLDGYQAKITTKNWATLNKCSRDTAQRDIADLLSKQILIEEIPGAKRPSYSINYNRGNEPATIPNLTDIKINEIEGKWMLTAVWNGSMVQERLTTLDIRRFNAGEVSPAALASKYFAYLNIPSS